jgi:hypothetical protein
MASEPKDNNMKETRQDKRAQKLRKKRTKMKHHGKGLAKMYEDSVKKRTKSK